MYFSTLVYVLVLEGFDFSDERNRVAPINPKGFVLNRRLVIRYPIHVSGTSKTCIYQVLVGVFVQYKLRQASPPSHEKVTGFCHDIATKNRSNINQSLTLRVYRNVLPPAFSILAFDRKNAIYRLFQVKQLLYRKSCIIWCSHTNDFKYYLGTSWS